MPESKKKQKKGQKKGHPPFPVERFMGVLSFRSHLFQLRDLWVSYPSVLSFRYPSVERFMGVLSFP